MWARVKLKAGVAGSNQLVGEHLAAWAEERAHSPIIELAGVPDAVSTGLAKAGVEVWTAAQTEAAKVLECERRRMEDAIAAERELRSEALGLVDARDAVIGALQVEIARQAAEIEAMREHLRMVRAREFWQRVIQEVREILPERKAPHVSDITLGIGADLVQEAAGHAQALTVNTVKGALDERMYRRYLVGGGAGRDHRRRPEDGGVAG